ncbi:MAG: hypothetical protein PHS79_04755 [Patescibacteria group bacterium]|nr:hypothetical protein [Patescibacteria group bacterium]
MSHSDSRYLSFHHFDCSKNGWALSRRINAMARHYMTGYAEKIDANWLEVIIEFKESYTHEMIEKPFVDPDSCRVTIDYRPTRIQVVGPNVGHHVLPVGEIFAVIPEPLLVFMCACSLLNRGHHVLRNPKHRIELIDGKTIIEFENCTAGVVRNVVNDDEFDVEDLAGQIKLDPSDQKHFTRATLQAGFKIEGLYGQPVCVDYFPLLPSNGIAINNADDVRESHRIDAARWEAERPQREAARAAEEAAAEAALTPEQRARRDAFRRRMAAQAEIIKTLMPVLPKLGE